MATLDDTDIKNPVDPKVTDDPTVRLNTSIKESMLYPWAQGETIADVLKNVDNPTIPTNAQQTYTALATGDVAGGSQFQSLDPNSPAFMQERGDAAAVTAPTTRATSGTATASTYDAMQVRAATPQMDSATGKVSKTVLPAQGTLSAGSITTGATGTVKPEDLVDPKTGTISDDSIVKAATDVNYGAYTINQVPRMTAAYMDGVKGTAAEGIAAQSDIEQAKQLMDAGDAEANAAIANLPPEALVTTQLSNLLSELEGGNTPSWARPAVAQVEAALAARGMATSTIGRDALFNAIIQAAMPMAQSNAQALQQRAAQNLSNQQEVNTLNAQLQQQRGLQMSNQVSQFLSQNTQLVQQMKLANLSNVQQMEVANLEFEFATNKENMSAENLSRLENLRTELQVAQNNQQVKQNLGLTNLSNKQQAALYNAQVNANMDVLNLNNQQQAAMANSQFFQTMSLTNLNNQQQATLQTALQWASMDMANLNNRQLAQVENARNFLQMDLSQLNMDQQAAVINVQNRVNTLLSDQSAVNAAKQFNAKSQTEVDTFLAQLATNVSLQNSAMANQMSQFNATQVTDINKFNAQLDAARDQFNSQMYAQIEQSNVTWRRQMNQIDTAGENAVNQANAVNSFNLSNQALNLLWQELRDAAKWSYEGAQAKAERDVRVAIAALGNESAESVASLKTTYDAMTKVGGFLSTLLS